MSGGAEGIVVRDLTKSYPDGTRAVDGVSFDVAPGEIVGLLGPNGAGKSTTMNILATLIPATGGRVSVCGVPLSDRIGIRSVTGVALQTSGLDPMMRVGDHFEVHAAMYELPAAAARRRAGELIDVFLLGDLRGRRAGTLSGGTQRRLALALALLHEPPAIIFDEPTVGLDPTLRGTVWSLLEDQRRRGLAVLFSTHYMDEADRLCQRIELISEGRIVATGTPNELKADSAAGVLRLRVDGSAAEAAELLNREVRVPEATSAWRTGDHDAVEIETGAGTFSPPSIEDALARAGIRLVDLHWGHATLDELFGRLASSSTAESAPSVAMEHRALARRSAR